MIDKAMISKRNKVTGEIVVIDGARFQAVSTGMISDATMAKIKAATEASGEWEIVGVEYTEKEYVMTEADKELKEYCDHESNMCKVMGA